MNTKLARDMGLEFPIFAFTHCRDVAAAVSKAGGIGVFGVVTWHPILKLPMPWWFRATLVGAWMNFVLTFFAYDDLQAAMVQIAGNVGVFGSPFWFTLEGAIVGYVMGFIANRLGREGPIRVKE